MQQRPGALFLAHPVSQKLPPSHSKSRPHNHALRFELTAIKTDVGPPPGAASCFLSSSREILMELNIVREDLTSVAALRFQHSNREQCLWAYSFA